MIIYVDVLLFVNLVTDFFLILASKKLSHSSVSTARAVAGAAVSSLFSLYIFWPYSSVLTDMAVRAAASALTCFVCLGRGSFKRFLRFFCCFYAVSFILAGLVLAVTSAYQSDRAAVNNGVVYFDISPVQLIVTSVVFYFVFGGLGRLIRRDTPTAKRCGIRLSFDDRSASVTAMLDTGHDVHDPYGDRNVIIVDTGTAELLLGKEAVRRLSAFDIDCAVLSGKVILLPLKTVAGETVMPAVTIDRASAVLDGTEYGIDDPAVMLSGEVLGDDYSAILSPSALNTERRMPVKEIRV